VEEEILEGYISFYFGQRFIFYKDVRFVQHVMCQISLIIAFQEQWYKKDSRLEFTPQMDYTNVN
jgi:hypothetical protein